MKTPEICPNCGAEVPPRAKACPECGFDASTFPAGQVAAGLRENIRSWRAPLQALYTAIKFPLIILLTTLGNGLLNAMLAPLLGVNLGLRQTLLAVFMSFTIAAAILGALLYPVTKLL